MGVSKAKILKGKYGAKLEWPEKYGGGGGGSNQNTFHGGGGGMDIFWNNTIRSRKLVSSLHFAFMQIRPHHWLFVINFSLV